MAIFQRISDIIAANVGEMIKRSRDPEATAAQVVSEMEGAVTSARHEVARAAAELKRAEKELETSRRLAARWHSKAAEALGAGDEASARRALARKRDYAGVAGLLEQHRDASRMSCEAIEKAGKTLETKLGQARRRQKELALGKRLAAAQAAADEALARGRDREAPRAREALDRFEDEANGSQARADALRDLSELARTPGEELADLEERAAFEEELEDLKKEVRARGDQE
jgi:phage shock protein A